MKLNTEMIKMESGNFFPFAIHKEHGITPTLHDAAAAHALMQAVKESKHYASADFLPYRIEERADAIMAEWGFVE